MVCLFFLKKQVWGVYLPLGWHSFILKSFIKASKSLKKFVFICQKAA